MTGTPVKPMTKTAKCPQLPAVIDPKPDHSPPHPHQNLDRSVRAVAARMSGGISTHSFVEAWTDWVQHISQSPGRQLELVEHAQRNALKLLAHSFNQSQDATPPFVPKAYDHRFDHPSWQKVPFHMWQQGFLAVQDWWDIATDHLRGLEPENADRSRFLARQILDLYAPSNFPWLNPEIISETFRSHGRNLTTGAANFAHDYVKTVTQAHDPAPEGYQIGQDLACTPGEVVFRNELFELIQYAPQTENVYSEPILIVPAWIMKYYILDLSPRNSMVRFLVAQGFTVFMISWCNPTAEQANLSLEDYRKDGVMAALSVVTDIVPDQKVHTVGYCLGGTILAIAAATMARDRDTRVASVTLMAAQVDFAEAGELLLFLDESQVAFLEDMMWDQGYLDRPQMARAFSTIRSEDLIYSRAVRRYFLGKQDLPTDMGVWVADTTRMPAQMHSEYLRSLFLENRLTAGRFAVEDRVIALKDISTPMFVIGTETDHIAPWKSVYKCQLFTDCDLTFVLTSGGHNSGIINEPEAQRGHYRLSHRAEGALYVGPNDWLPRHLTQKGSWWPQWAAWLTARNGPKVPAPTSAGAPDTGHSPIMAAPGSFVHQT
jgi:polyhydroxyalkanoate synthase